MGEGSDINGNNSNSQLVESGLSRHEKARNIEWRSNSDWSNGNLILVTVGDSSKGSNHRN